MLSCSTTPAKVASQRSVIPVDECLATHLWTQINLMEILFDEGAINETNRVRGIHCAWIKWSAYSVVANYPATGLVRQRM
jgi:hypothetical protein